MILPDQLPKCLHCAHLVCILDWLAEQACTFTLCAKEVTSAAMSIAPRKPGLPPLTVMLLCCLQQELAFFRAPAGRDRTSRWDFKLILRWTKSLAAHRFLSQSWGQLGISPGSCEEALGISSSVLNLTTIVSPCRDHWLIFYPPSLCCTIPSTERR